MQGFQLKSARGSGPYRGNLEIKIPLDMSGASVFAYESFCNHLEQVLDWCCILDFGRFRPPVELPKLASHPVWTCAGGWVLLWASQANCGTLRSPCVTISHEQASKPASFQGNFLGVGGIYSRAGMGDDGDLFASRTSGFIQMGKFIGDWSMHVCSLVPPWMGSYSQR